MFVSLEKWKNISFSVVIYVNRLYVRFECCVSNVTNRLSYFIGCSSFPSYLFFILNRRPIWEKGPKSMSRLWKGRGGWKNDGIGSQLVLDARLECVLCIKKSYFKFLIDFVMLFYIPSRVYMCMYLHALFFILSTKSQFHPPLCEFSINFSPSRSRFSPLIWIDLLSPPNSDTIHLLRAQFSPCSKFPLFWEIKCNNHDWIWLPNFYSTNLMLQEHHHRSHDHPVVRSPSSSLFHSKSVTFETISLPSLPSSLQLHPLFILSLVV